MKDLYGIFEKEVKMPSCEIPAPVLAMAYVPMQSWQKIYSPELGLERGTIFQELDKPFIGRDDC